MYTKSDDMLTLIGISMASVGATIMFLPIKLQIPYRVYIFLIGALLIVFGIILLKISEVTGNLKNKHYHVYNKLLEYIKSNKTSLNLFAQATIKKLKIILANKFMRLEVNMGKVFFSTIGFSLTDKINAKKYNYIIASEFSLFYIGSVFFTKLFDILDYETKAEDILSYLEKYGGHIAKQKVQKLSNQYLDINQASEAELTALPGVTIAKAKHAIKVRNKQKRFLTMNQFYKAINLDEEFIAQIPTKGNKIILNELPEYKRLEMKKEE